MEEQVFWKGEREILREGSVSFPAQSLLHCFGLYLPALCTAIEYFRYSFQEQRINTSNNLLRSLSAQLEPPPSLVVFMKTLFKWGKQEKSKQIPRPTQHFFLQHSHSCCVGSIIWQRDASGSCYFKLLAAHHWVGLLYLVSSYILLLATFPVLYIYLLWLHLL